MKLVVCGLWFERLAFLRPSLKPQATFLVLLLSLLASAHPANVASSQIKAQPDGTFVARVRFDVAAFVTGATPLKADDDAMNALLDGTDDALKKALADAEARFRAGFATDPGGTLDKVAFPTVADVRRYLESKSEPRLPMMLTTTVEGHLPAGARTVAFRYPPVVDTVIQTVEFPYEEPVSEPVEAGQASTRLTIPTAEEVAKLAASMEGSRDAGKEKKPPEHGGARAGSGKVSSPPKPSIRPPTLVHGSSLPGEGRVRVAPAKLKPAVAAKSEPTEPDRPKHDETHPPATLPRKGGLVVSEPPSNAVASPPSRSPFLTYLRMGYAHILPQGLDHILFVLGLFLLGSNARALLKQITAFTIAHSITLALATLDLVRLPGRVIEPLIALSIAFVAIENLFLSEVKPWRTAVVFLFGLVHGMGFAEVFRDAGLSGGGLATALVSFNVGVEAGQLSVVALALLAVGWFRKDPRYRRFVVVPASVTIAAVGLFWTAQRAFGIGV